MSLRDADFFEAFLSDLQQAIPQTEIKEPHCLLDQVAFGHLFARMSKHPDAAVLRISVWDFVELWPEGWTQGAHGPPDLLERRRANDVFFTDDLNWFDAVVVFIQKQLDARNLIYPRSYVGVWPLKPFCAQTEMRLRLKDREARP